MSRNPESEAKRRAIHARREAEDVRLRELYDPASPDDAAFKHPIGPRILTWGAPATEDDED